MTFDAAARMDRMYRAQRHIYDITRKPYLLGRDAMLDGLAPPPGGSVLEIGCGTGRNLIAAASRYPTANFHGFDISRVMLDTAQKSIAAAGLGQKVALAIGDATSFDPLALFGRSDFDRVFVSYVLSMIPAWREVISAAAKVLAPRGSLHIVDFGQQSGLPRAFKAGLFSWLSLFHVTPRAELKTEAARVAARMALGLDYREPLRGYCEMAVLRRP